MPVRGHSIAVAFFVLWAAGASAQTVDPVAEAALGAWPCLDRPGCAGAPPAPEAADLDVTALFPPEPSAIPLPAALALLGGGLTALAFIGRRR